MGLLHVVVKRFFCGKCGPTFGALVLLAHSIWQLQTRYKFLLEAFKFLLSSRFMRVCILRVMFEHRTRFS